MVRKGNLAVFEGSSISETGVDVTCMYTNIGGRDPSSFGDTATFKNGQISLLYHGL